MTQALHSDEIPIDAELVRLLVSRVMPAFADAPVRRLAASGSTNALFRLGEEFLVRLPRQPGGSETISKEAKWLPVLGPLLPVPVPHVVAVFEPDCGYPERWSVVRWIDGAHPAVVDPDTMSAQEIARISNGARLVVGLEGSHLAHSIYPIADAGTLLVLQPPLRFNNVYKDLSDAMGLNYAFLVGEPAAGGFTVDLDRLGRLLDRVGA